MNGESSNLTSYAHRFVLYLLPFEYF